eukprot:CAMPEP_0181343336 /NCGR_PEP_ID=MMETSP1101-20121128/31526_1 /TAXON_ID=46948 /ORGANISM="Rhodomonas abbreviata, Strain Caron Lab Isolate" /LENGTH=69 /DNA_ID=CAMNT_0023454947 /DNA_START=834 /DNA_END=1044 /DNA_ORIENTATION=-
MNGRGAAAKIGEEHQGAQHAALTPITDMSSRTRHAPSNDMSSSTSHTPSSMTSLFNTERTDAPRILVVW